MDVIIYPQCQQCHGGNFEENSVMVETLKTCDVSETNYSGGNGLRARNVV